MRLTNEEISKFTEGMFDLLVKNAIDFLERATAEIEDRPKYSIINFFSAVELFFKARLMREHWSLIIAKPEDASITKFRDGDFQSVTLEQATKRLKNISSENITDEEMNSFNDLRKHRNKLVHFFHSQYAEEPDEETLQNTVAELSKAWLFLYRLLTGKWNIHFQEYEESFDELVSEMNRLKQFLKAKYEVLLPEIEKEINRGRRYYVCSSCGFRAARVDDSQSPLTQLKCKVCGWHTSRLIVSCPNCSQEVEVKDGWGTCENCETDIDLDYLIDNLGAQDENLDPKEALDAGGVHAYCSECEYPEKPTVVPFNDQWLCLHCQYIHSQAIECAWCNTFVAGSYENTYLTGCMWCEGMMGHYSDE
jgi:hypothetical protein